MATLPATTVSRDFKREVTQLREAWKPIAKGYAEAEELIPSITKFTSVLTEEQRDFVGAARLAIADNLDWTA